MRLLTILSFFICLAQSLMAQDLSFHLRHPTDQDTVSSAKTRLSGVVSDTNATVTVNEKQLRVYSSGVFVSLLELKPGWNPFVITARTDKQTVRDTVRVFRPEPLKSLPEKPTAFGDQFLLPRDDMTFYSPAEIEVQFMGSPGGKASFEIDDLFDDPLPMVELPESETGGIQGVYRGVYQIKAGDACDAEPVIFTLEGKDNDEEEWETERKITVNQTGQPYIVSTTCDYSLVYYSPWGEILMELPEKVKLEVIADLDDWILVRAIDGVSGYIRSRCTEAIGRGDRVPHGRFGGFNTRITDDWYIFSMGLGERVPFRMTQKQIPQAIELTLFNAHVSDEWTVLPEAGPSDSSLLKYFEWQQVRDNELRLTFYLNTTQQWGYRAWYEGNTLKLAVRKPPKISADAPFANLNIALDAGHGGDHSGAVGATGYMEKEVNLKYTGYLAEMLREAGANVILTRTIDTTMNLQPRADIALAGNAHILVWLHNNAIGRTSDPEKVKGTSTYYTHAQGLPFAQYVYPELMDLGLAPFGKVHRTYFITRQTGYIVFLVEGAFMSNPEDEIFLMEDENLRKLAGAVFTGMKKYLLTLAEIPVRDKLPEAK